MASRMLVVVAILLGVVAAAAGSGLSERWSVPLGEGQQLDAGPVAYAERVGEPARLVVWGSAGRLLAYDGEGRQVWAVALGSDPQRAACIADLDRDGYNELLVNAGDDVVCVGRRGKVAWRTTIPDGTESVPVAADVTGDGRLEVIAVNGGGAVVCLDARGRLLWHLLAESAHRPVKADPWISRLNWNYERYDNRDMTVAPAVGDVNGDGRAEILAGNEPGFLYCLSGGGRLLWQFRASGAISAAPVIADLEGDGRTEVVVGAQDRRLYVLEGATGRRRTAITLEWAPNPATAVADLDGDGRLEIIAGDQRGVVYCFETSGRERWRLPFKGPRVAEVGDEPTAPPAIADVDGDGALELVQGIKSREKLYVISAAGKIEEEYVMESGKPALMYEGGVRQTPAIADLDGDGWLEVIAGTRVTAVRCLGTTAKASGAVAWTGDRGTPSLTGCAPSEREGAKGRRAPLTPALSQGERERGQVRLSATAADLVSGEVRADITRPAGTPAVLLTTIRMERGPAEYRVDQVLTSQESFGIAVPVEDDWPRSLHCTLVAADTGAALAYANLQVGMGAEEARATVGKEAEAAAGSLNEGLNLGWSSAAAMLAARAEARRGWNDAPATPTVLACRRLEAGRGFAALPAQVKAGTVYQGTALCAWTCDPWEAFHEATAWPTQPAGPAVVISLCQGEREAGGLDLLNLAPTSLPVLVTWGDLAGEGGARLPASALEVRQTTMTPRYTGEMVGDALLPLNAAAVVTMAPLRAAQLFITADAHGAAPGTYRGEICMQELRTGGKAVKVPIEARVWPVEIPAKAPVHLCTWAYFDAMYPVSRYVDACLADLVAHRNNVFCVTASPKVTYDEKGVLSPIDWSAYDVMVNRYRPHGFLLIHSWNPLAYRGAGPEPKEAAGLAFTAFIQALGRHMTDLGIAYADWAIYIMDEPGLDHGPRIEYVLDYGKRIRAADPSIRIYTDPVLPAQAEDLKAMAPLIDIWQPEQDSYYRLWGETADMHSAERLAIMQQDSDQVWTYECFPRVKKMSPLGYYRHQGWLAQMVGINGLGFWTYGTDAKSPWEPGNDEYVLVYPGAEGPIPSKRWEACRDAVEDWILVWLARQAPGAAQVDPIVKRVVEERATWESVRQAREQLVSIINGK